MDAYAHAAKPFSFRDTGPTLERVAQAQFSRDQGSTTDMTVEDCVGFKIKATKKVKEADIIEEFNQTLHNHFNYPTEPMIVWSEDKITLTKDWVDFANQFPLEVLESGQKYVIPDPRSLPDGNPATSVFATQEE